MPNISGSSGAARENLTVYRLTPWNVTDLADHNAGDVQGDLGFVLANYINSGQCAAPPYNTQNCFLDDRPLIASFDVEVDSRFGPYLMCNPSQQSNGLVNTSVGAWVCAYNYVPVQWRAIKPSQCAPPCQRANVSVGKDPVLHHFWLPKNRRNMLSYFGGYWYSMPKAGRCTGADRPSDHAHAGAGSGCTWRVNQRPTCISARCLVDRLLDQLTAANRSCFAPCGPGAVNASSPPSACVSACVQSTIMSGIDIKRMTSAWLGAFDPHTGCPRTHVDRAVKKVPRVQANSHLARHHRLK